MTSSKPARTTTRRTPRILVAGLLVVIAATAAACGYQLLASSSSTGTGDSTATSGGNSTAATHEKAVKFAECMRANGVRAFPDPDATGALTIDAVANGSSLDTSSLAFEQALNACKDLEPPGF